MQARCRERRRVRTTTRGESGQWSREDMEKACDHVRRHLMSVAKAAKAFSIPRSTLHLKVHGWKGKSPREPTADAVGGGGRKSTLPLVTELKFIKYLDYMNKWGFGLSKVQILDAIQSFSKETNLKSTWKDDRPGDDWWISFCKRHKLSLKKPERLEGSRSRQAGDPFIVQDFYDKLETLIKELNLTEKPQCIYNCDETGVNHDPGSTKILSKKSVPAQRLTGGSGRDFTTVLGCVSADGNKLPPLILHKGKRMWNSMFGDKTKEYPGTSYYVSDKGWMTEEVFTSWFKKVFIPNVKEFPALLVYDGHLSHIGINLVEEAIMSNVAILKLPPHTSHFLQPLDVSVFRGFKSRWDTILAEWTRHNSGQRLPKSAFANLLGKTWKTIDPQQIISGFKKTGIYDETFKGVNREAVSATNFHPEKLERYNKFVQEKGIIVSSPLPASPDTPSASLPSTSSADQGATSFNSPAEMNQIPETPGKSFERILLKTVAQTGSEPKKCKRRIDIAEVITQDDYLTNLKKRKSEQVGKAPLKKNQRQNKSKSLKKIKRKQPDFFHEEADSEFEDDVGIPPIEESVPCIVPCIAPKIVVHKCNDIRQYTQGTYVLVNFKGGRKDTTYVYACVIQRPADIEEGDEEPEVSVMALNCTNAKKTIFIMNENDISFVKTKDILGIIPSPEIKTNGCQIRYEFASSLDEVFEMP